jgi:hypothetical protein
MKTATLLLLSACLFGQMRENTEKTMTCEAGWKSDQARS